MIAILGTGKMGEALLSGLLRAGRPPSGVIAAVRREERGTELGERYGVQTADAATAAKMADTLVLAVKPQDMGRLLDEIAPWLESHAAETRRMAAALDLLAALAAGGPRKDGVFAFFRFAVRSAAM